MSWNYRVLQNENSVAIYEVYYDENGEPHSCTMSPVSPLAEDVEGLKKDLEKMEQAFDKPVLEYEDF
jgi:hypothetical protein